MPAHQPNKKTVGSYLIELLAANGIDTVFGIPGVHTLELYRGLAGSSLRHVLTRHEQGAGFAADGYARITGRAAAAFVISGPGLTNILTAVGQSYSDSVPLLVIASTPARATLGKRWGVLHELRAQRALAAEVFAFARTAATAEDVRDHVRAAFACLRQARPRPAFIDVPLDLLAEFTEHRAQRFAVPHLTAPASQDGIEAAAALLENARRPFIIAGGGARAADRELTQLVASLDALFATTAAGKGLVMRGHHAHLGASLPYRETQTLMAAADVVLAVGTELSETDSYTTNRLPRSGRMIRIDVDPVKLNDQYEAEIALCGDARLTLQSLLTKITSRNGWGSEFGDSASHRRAIESGFDPLSRMRARALAAIRACLPANGAVFSDMTQIAYLGNYAYSTDTPGTWFHPSGFGTLGFALPAAIGAKIAAPNRAIIALAGDFGVQFTSNEIMTAVEEQLSLPIVVWNNSALGQIRDDMCGADIGAIAVVARNPDFVALARACGAEGARVHDPTQLSTAIETALCAGGPTLIEAVEADFPLD
jgi:5-guanidino-2-oxopentanoate decarboxylase